MGFMPILNDNDKTKADGVDDNDNIIVNGHDGCVESIENRPEKVIAASERRGTRPLPTPLYDIIGTFKSLTQNEYADHVRNNGWPPFRNRLWQLRFHDHIIRNETELNRIRQYIEDNPKNWAEDKNNLENFGHDTDS